MESLGRELERARGEIDEIESETLDDELTRLDQELRNARDALTRTLRDLEDMPELPSFEPAETTAACRGQGRALQDSIDEMDDAIEEADGALDRADDAGSSIGGGIDETIEAGNKIRRYRRELERYQHCLEEKIEALERLREIFAEDEDATLELLDNLHEGLTDANKRLGELKKLVDLDAQLGDVGEIAEQLSKRLGQLSEGIAVVDQVVRAASILVRAFDTEVLSPSDTAQVMADLFTLSNDLIPQPPVVDQFIDFYSDALQAIAQALGHIQRRLVHRWMSFGLSFEEIESGGTPPALLDEIRRAFEIRDLLETINRECKPPTLDP